MENTSRGGIKTAPALPTMSLIIQKICEHLERILGNPVPNRMQSKDRIESLVEPSELWLPAENILTLYPPGSAGRKNIVGVFVRRLKQKPELISRLHPATSPFHMELINAIAIHPELTPELRLKMLDNREITAALL